MILLGLFVVCKQHKAIWPSVLGDVVLPVLQWPLLILGLDLDSYIVCSNVCDDPDDLWKNWTL